MANLGTYKDTWKQALDLNRRYYGTLGRATVDYLRGLAAMLEAVSENGNSGTGSAPPRPHDIHSHDTAAPRTGKPAAVLVLEAEAGVTAVGVFLVENNLGHAINARPRVSGFADGYDRHVHPEMTFEPPELALGPGEQTLVRILAAIDASMEPNIRYRGELTVEELPGTRIPIVIRRRDQTTAT